MTTVRKRAQLYLGWQWRQARGCAGRTAVPTKTNGVAGYPLTSPALWNKKNNTISTKFRQNLPCTGRFPKLARKKSAQWPTTQFWHDGHTSTIPARRPHIHNSFSMLTWPYCYSYNTTLTRIYSSLSSYKHSGDNICFRQWLYPQEIKGKP
jgi:hypothetical protein